jgi:diguanylate cyclase (GGDEF)-like protein
MRVVLVDPSRTAAKFVSRLLEARHHEVRTFADGREALEYIKSDPEVGALITSTEPLSISGLELCWETRLIATSHRPIYVILMSSSTEDDKLILALDHGADDFLGKPPVAEELYARLRAAERLSTMQSELIRLATTDSLTGMFNRRAFFENAKQLCVRAESGYALSAVMVDIDHFKDVNDLHGHDVGDEAIYSVAHELMIGRAVVGRLGGEEFALLLDRPMAEVQEVAERLRLQIAALKVGVMGLSITCSFGVSEWQSGDSIDRMLKRADMALYEAKLNGRNRVVVADNAMLAPPTATPAGRSGPRARSPDLGCDHSDSSTPGIDRFDAVRDRGDRRVGGLQARGHIVERLGVGGLYRKPSEARAIGIASANSVAVPHIGADVVMIAARRHEGGASAPARHLHTDHIAVERFRPVDVADAQMDVADAQAPGSFRISCGGGIDFADNRLDVERVGLLEDHLAFAPPAIRLPVRVYLDAIAFRIIEVDRFADVVIGRAADRHAALRDVQDPACEVCARRHQEGGVIEARGALVVGLGVRPVLDLDQRDAAGAEPREAQGVLLNVEAQQILVVARKQIEIAGHEGDRADVQRRAVREGGVGRRVLCVHGAYIGLPPRQYNGLAAT